MFPIGDDEDWKITPTDQNESGIFLFVLDDLSNFDGYWLCQNQQIFNPAGYGDITFGADDDVPVPPENIWVSTIFYNDETLAEINCTQPPINDFYHFKVYLNNGSEC